MKISVIIPVYNVEKYLGKCLKSIDNQTFKDFEIILINDGSTDDSQKIIDAFVEECKCKVRCVIKQNAGQAAARNQGLKMAVGDYIAFIDSDDYLKEDYLEVLYNAAIENDSQVVACGYFQVDEGGNILRENRLTSKSLELYGRAGMSVVWGKLFEREFLIQNEFEFQEGGKIFEDVPYSIRAKFLSKNPIVLNYCGYYYVRRLGSTMNSGTVKSSRFPYEKMTEAIESSINNSSDEIRKRLEFEVIHFFAGFLFLYCRKASLDDINNILCYCKEILCQYFPRYYKNPYVGITKNLQQPFIDRCCVKFFVITNKLGLLDFFVRVFTRF